MHNNSHSVARYLCDSWSCLCYAAACLLNNCTCRTDTSRTQLCLMRLPEDFFRLLLYYLGLLVRDRPIDHFGYREVESAASAAGLVWCRRLYCTFCNQRNDMNQRRQANRSRSKLPVVHPGLLSNRRLLDSGRQSASSGCCCCCSRQSGP